MPYNYSAQARATFAVDRRVLYGLFDAPIIGFVLRWLPVVLLGDVEKRLKTLRDEYRKRIAGKRPGRINARTDESPTNDLSKSHRLVRHRLRAAAHI